MGLRGVFKREGLLVKDKYGRTMGLLETEGDRQEGRTV